MKVVYKIRTKVDKEVVKRLKTHKQIYKVKRNKQGQTIVDVGKHDFYDFTNKRIKEYTVNIPTELQDKEPLVEYMEGFYKGYIYIVTGLSGKKLKPYYIQKLKSNPEGIQGLFCCPKALVVIKVEVKSLDFTIYKLKAVNKKDKVHCSIKMLWTSPPGEVDIEDLKKIKHFNNAILAAKEKANTYKGDRTEPVWWEKA